MPKHKVPPQPQRPFPGAVTRRDASQPQSQQASQSLDETALLTVDSSARGNVARLINHSCNPNLVVQAVLAGRARSTVLYYLAMYAARQIDTHEELTIDYGTFGRGTRHNVTCMCGAENCRREL